MILFRANPYTLGRLFFVRASMYLSIWRTFPYFASFTLAFGRPESSASTEGPGCMGAMERTYVEVVSIDRHLTRGPGPPFHL